MEAIINFDKEVFLFLNQLNHPYLDQLMEWITFKWTWVPLYAFLIIKIYLRFKSNSLPVIIALVCLVVVTDQLSSGFLKPFFERIRPCHEEQLSGLINQVVPCGGQFSFVSGHAANSFALAIFIWLSFGKAWHWIILWATLVAYSRVYVGVHYPLDIIFGAFLGAGIGYTIFWFLNRINQRIFNPL